MFFPQDGFGFIETINHDEEIYFHFSNFIGNSNNLELGQEVEYTISTRPNSTTAGSCLPAENVKTLQKGSIQQPKIFENVFNGEVVRPLRCVNPDQSEYCGLIKLSNENGDTMSTHEFGITSLTNKRHLLQKYDVVTFKKDENGRANEVCCAHSLYCLATFFLNILYFYCRSLQFDKRKRQPLIQSKDNLVFLILKLKKDENYFSICLRCKEMLIICKLEIWLNFLF